MGLQGIFSPLSRFWFDAKAIGSSKMKYIHIDQFDEQAFVDFDGSEVVVSAEFVMFWKPPNPFGQWTISPFEIDGLNYVCAEQYMMAEKARLFGDYEISQQIMATESPREQKKLGKKVSGFKDEVWNAERSNIVVRGNIAKFSQNELLREKLLETGELRMVEASPLDKIWGIGLAANDPKAYDPNSWRGLNLLGNALEKVRDHLRDND